MIRFLPLALLSLLLLSCNKTPLTQPPANQLPLASSTDHGAEVYRLISQPDEIVSVLKNGMVVIAKRVHSPVTTVRGYVAAGGIHEGKWLGGGLSHLLEHLVAGGSNGRRTEEENRNLLQELGNNSNAYTYADRTAYFVNTTTDNAEKAVDLITGWMLTARITPDEYAREYQVVQRELEKDKGEADWVFYELTQNNRYLVSPAKVPVIGYKEVIQGLSRDDVYAYYKLAYVPNNMIFVISGDLDPQLQLDLVRKYVRDAAPGRAFSHDIQPEPPVQAPRTLVATFPRLGLARVQLAFPSLRMSDKDLYALDLLATVLGGGDSSILNEEVRDKLRLVTSISVSNPTPPYVDGSFQIEMQTDPEKITQATKAVLDILERIKKQGVDADRVDRAKAIMRTSTIYSRQTTEAIAESLADGYLSVGDPHFLDHYTQRILKVAPAEMKTMANAYLDPSRLITTIMLPEETVGAGGLPKAQEIIAASTGKTAAAEKASPVQRTVLDNGTVLLVKRMTAAPIVSINLFARGGVSIEDEKTNGLSHLAMDMLQRGTKTRKAQQIAEELDALGAAFDGAAANNTVSWKITCTREDFAKTMNLFADLVNNPVFPADEFPAVKERTLAAIAGQDSDWYTQAMRFFRQTYFAPLKSPYQFTVLGTDKTVGSFTVEAVRDWYQQKLLATPRVLAIYGDVDLAQAKSLASQYFSGGAATPVQQYKTGPATAAVSTRPAIPSLRVSRVEINKTTNPQAAVVIGFESNSIVGESASAAIDVADCMTSGYGYPTGYIFEILRGRGLVYDANAMNFPGTQAKTPGTFIAYAGCDPANVNEVVDVIIESVARLQGSDADMKKEWFDRSKRLIITGDAVDNETAASQAMTAALDELYGLGYQYHDNYPDRIRSVTIEQIRALAALRLIRCVVTISTPEPEKVKIPSGERNYRSFAPVDLTPRGVQHDNSAGSK